MQAPLDIKNIGLKQAEILLLEKKYGRNEFEADTTGSIFPLVWGIVKEPMFLMLLAACLLYFILGQAKEGFLMLAAMVFVGAISVYQEVKSTNALAALKQYTQPKVIVIRDGAEKTILSRDLVPGDVMVLEEGSRIPTDAMVLQSNDLTVNESIITGESMPADKNGSSPENQLFQGTMINTGKCLAKVTATGNLTVLGKLGKSISSISVSKTLLQEQITRFVKIMATMGIIIFCLIWLVNYLHTKELIQSLLLGLTLAMAIFPEEIPVAFSSFMALGAFHMAKLGIITRQPLTIENLGAVSIICLDKTGTITENKMEVKSIYNFEKDLLEEIKNGTDLLSQDVLRYARLASEGTPFDAMEKAIVCAFEMHSRESVSLPSMVHEYPLGGKPPMMTHVYEWESNKMIAGKGAPERILNVCRLDQASKMKMQSIVIQMASMGYRVLGVCAAAFNGIEYPAQQDDFPWEFKGLLALYDPPKKGVKTHFDTWSRAGIQIKLVTGDYKETALNIATQVGMKLNGPVITGEQIMKMPTEGLQKEARESSIFARMFPEAKLKLIDALKANGEIVAMMGDGVNDGPALKSAQIGIAMGDKGTEIAREAAGLVLTDDDMGKVTEAIRQGRKIYYNLKKAIRYIISIHVPIVLTASVPLLLGWKFTAIFTPIHIIFLELVMGPTCSVFFEREPVEPGIMLQPPRSHTHSIFTSKELLISLLQGLAMAVGLLIVYYFYMTEGYDISYIRTVVFTTLIISNIFLTFVNRSFEENIFKTVRYKNTLTPYVLFASIVFLCCISFIPFIRQLFELTHLHPAHYFLSLGLAMVITWWFEIYKTVNQWIKLKKQHPLPV